MSSLNRKVTEQDLIDLGFVEDIYMHNGPCKSYVYYVKTRDNPTALKVLELRLWDGKTPEGDYTIPKLLEVITGNCHLNTIDVIQKRFDNLFKSAWDN